MGIYVYGIKKRTRRHPFWGEVGVLRFLHKPAGYWAEDSWLKAQEKRENYYINAWRGHELPKIVCHERDTDFENLYWYVGKSPLWSDCDERACIPFESQWGREIMEELRRMNAIKELRSMNTMV